MKVFELDKYLDKHNLLTGKKALKDDKVKCIISHVLTNDSSATHTNVVACASYKERECVDESDKAVTTTTMTMRGQIQKRTWS